MTVYLTAEQVLFVHYRLVSETGGEYGVRDLGLLESAVARPQAKFDRQELYPDIFEKAAALMESLINNHPFVDGNKRTGIACAVLFLQQNGISFSARNAELEKFTLRIASSMAGRAEIIEWLKKHSHA
ncbi:MAG TPA: type II toxin-antitoxin system death-on-curing family toxin [Anaerolineales bacterium]|nr:type II toxin-antitoxin system death-on-curing family toxin [Anaerolineales bacterium]